MKVARRSPFSGKMHEMELDITVEQWERYRAGGGYIQDIFPNLSDDEREFIKTGITPEEWDKLGED